MKSSQEIANTIKAFSKSKGIPVGKMLTDCNLSVNTLSSMQAGGYYPRLEAIAKIADYLDCSVDYLMGNTDNPTPADKIKKLPASGGELAEEALDRELIARLCRLSVEELARVDAFVQGLLASH